MSRYIDADELREHLQNKLKTDYEMGLYNHGALTESFLRFVERQPTADVVKVVRCKDCRHQDECNQYVLISGDEGELAFCSYGERSENGKGTDN